MDVVDVPGAMRLVMPGNVRALDPAPALFEAMLTGWTRQQQSRLLAAKTIADRTSLPRGSLLDLPAPPAHRLRLVFDEGSGVCPLAARPGLQALLRPRPA
ncbi:hypothetical protein [Streptomyces yangpuensis]|uniref:hypothetical protein n=1 Tax=Streptomyces yangpuensis TaxID=1648182 RepID=UPI0038068E16